MSLLRDQVAKVRTAEGIPDRFVRTMDTYRAYYGAKPYEPEALQLGAEELKNIPMDRLEDLVRQAGREETEAMNMPRLVRWIRDKQKPPKAMEPVHPAEQGNGFNQAELQECLARKNRMMALAKERGLEWWSEQVRQAVAWASKTLPADQQIPQTYTDSLIRRGPSCMMTFVVLQPWLRTQPFWPQLEGRPQAITPSSIRFIHRPRTFGNAAAYREGDES